jgi:hypothetical protein
MTSGRGNGESRAQRAMVRGVTWKCLAALPNVPNTNLKVASSSPGGSRFSKHGRVRFFGHGDTEAPMYGCRLRSIITDTAGERKSNRSTVQLERPQPSLSYQN